MSSLRAGPGARRPAAIVLLAASLATPAAGGDWPQLLGPARDGVAGSVVGPPWSDGAPRELWRRPVGSGFAGPAVTGGRLYLFHREGDEEVLEALDARSGERLWRRADPATYRDDFRFDDGPRATPTVVGDRVVTLGPLGHLRTRNALTGELLWRVDTRARFATGKGYFGVAGSPLVDDGRVLLNLGGPDGAGISAFALEDGRLLWSATDHEASYSSPVAADLARGRRIVFFTREGLVVAHPVSGAVEAEIPWRARIKASVNAATPVLLGGGRVFLSASYGTGAGVFDLNATPPKTTWTSDESLTNHYATSVLADEVLYGFHGRQERGPDLRAVRTSDGAVLWSEARFGAGTILRTKERLIVMREDGELVITEASSEAFRPLHRQSILGGTVRAYPALADGVLFVRDDDELVAVDLGRRRALAP